MAQTQVYSPEAVENFATAFPRRSENSFAWGNAISYYLGLPQLRGFWPMSSVNENGNPYDLSGQNRILTNNNAAIFGVYGLQSYTVLNGVNQFHSRADEAGLDITGAITLGMWYRLTSANNAPEIFAIKDGAYGVYKPNNSSVVGIYGTAGAVTYNVTLDTRWHFVATKFIPTTSISIFYDNTITTQATAAAANPNSANPLTVGANSASAYVPANISLFFLCAAACSDAQINALYYLTRGLFYGT